MTASRGVVVWSQTAASNNTADSAINWSEGQAPSSVNDSARGEMASVAKWRDDNNGSLGTAGSSTAYTLTTNQNFSAANSTPVADYTVAFQIDEDCGTPVTLAVDSLAAKPLRPFPGVELVAGALKAGGIYGATYKTSNSGEWILHDVNPTIISAGQVVTASIADASVTLAKMENRSANSLIGRYSASTGAPQEVTVGAGLLLNTSTGNLTSAFPAGAFKSLVIKVTGNTGLTATADFVATTDGTTWQTTALSSTINMGTTGANALDTGSIASATWYAIWAIAKADGTTGGLASTSFTSPTMPSGYTFKTRIGAVRTASGLAQLLGTWQFGKRSQYVLGLAQTGTSYPRALNSASSQPLWTAVSLSSFVPTTASEASIIWRAAVSNGNAGISANGSANAIADGLAYINNAGAADAQQSVSFVLEGSNMYVATGGGITANRIAVSGWNDNI